MSTAEEARFLELVLADPTVARVLERAPGLGLDDWWLTAGVLFQRLWNADYWPELTVLPWEPG